MENIQTASSNDLSLEFIIGITQQFEIIEQSITKQNEIARIQEKKTSTAIKNCKYSGNNHELRNCPAYGKTCKLCGKQNHFAKMCKSKSVKEVSAEENQIYNIKSKNGPMIRKIKMNEIELPMLVDSGSDCTIITEEMWTKLGSPKLKKTSKILRQFDGSKIPTMGTCSITIEWEGKYVINDVIVTKIMKEHGLLGNDIMNCSFSINEIQNVN